VVLYSLLACNSLGIPWDSKFFGAKRHIRRDACVAHGGRSARPARDSPAVRSAAAACPLALLRGDASNLAHILLGEPDVAIRPDCDALRSAIGRGGAEPGEAAAGRDAPDDVPNLLGEPEIATRAARDAPRRAGTIFPTGPWQAELGKAATGGDAPDLVPILQNLFPTEPGLSASRGSIWASRSFLQAL